MRREPSPEAGQADATQSRLSSEWSAFRARLPYRLRALITVVAALIVIVGLPWSYFNIKYSREVERELARLRDAGEPLTIEEMIPKPVPDDQNAAIIYQEVFQVDFESPLPSFPRKLVPAVLSSEEWRRLEDSTKPGEKFEVELARRMFSSVGAREVLAKLDRASRMPRAVWPVRWEDGYGALFPHMVQYREAARVCSKRARLSAAEGDVDDALRWVGTSLRMSKHVMPEPTLIAQLVAIAMNAIALHAAEDALNTGMPSPEAAAEMRELAGSVDMTAGFHRALQGERAIGLAAFGGGGRGGTEALDSLLDESIPAPVFGPYGLWVGAPLRAFDQARFLNNWRTTIPNLDKSYRLQDIDASERALRAESKMAILTRVLLPALGRASMKRDHAIANLDELCIVLDLKMYKREHGSYPATLDELTTESPEDPFSGEAYRYERRGEGFILWSIGQDLEDDGGLRRDSTRDASPYEADIVWECEG